MKKVAPILLILSLAIVGVVAFSRRTQTPSDNASLMALPTPKSGGSSTADSALESTDTGLTISEPVKEITLTMTAPANGSTTTNASTIVRGKTVPKADVFINEYSLKADGSGNFSYTVTLDEGENIIIVVANDENGNLAEAELIVNYQPSE